MGRCSHSRRHTLALTNLLVSMAVFAMALHLLLEWPTAVGAVCLCLIMLLFSLGPGPLTFVVVNEMLPLALRAKVVAAAVFTNRFGIGAAHTVHSHSHSTAAHSVHCSLTELHC